MVGRLESDVLDRLPGRFTVAELISGTPESFTVRAFDSGIHNHEAVIKGYRLGSGGEPELEHALNQCRELFELLRSVRHTSVASPYAHASLVDGANAAWAYDVRRFVEGTPMSQFRVPLESRQVILVGRQLARALGVMHDRGLVHADLKPGNVVVRRATASRFDYLSQCVLIDIEVRTAVQSHRRADSLSNASVQFAAPELFEGSPPGISSDLYALGATLYWLLTGELPFAGGSLAEILQSQRRLELSSHPTAGTQSSVALEKLLLALIDPYPDNRPSSAYQLDESLRALCLDADLPLGSVWYDSSHWPAIGVDESVHCCVEVLGTSGPQPSPLAIVASGPRGCGMTMFLREVHDQLEARGRQVVSLGPHSLLGRSMLEQLVDGLNVPSGRRPASEPPLQCLRTAAEVLDIVAISAEDKPIVLVVDDWNELDESEASLLHRIVRQESGRSTRGNERRGGVHLVIGVTGSGTEKVQRDLARIGATVHGQELRGLTLDASIELANEVVGRDNVPIATLRDIHRDVGGLPALFVSKLRAQICDTRESTCPPENPSEPTSRVAGCHAGGAGMIRPPVGVKYSARDRVAIALSLLDFPITEDEFDQLAAQCGSEGLSATECASWLARNDSVTPPLLKLRATSDIRRVAQQVDAKALSRIVGACLGALRQRWWSPSQSVQRSLLGCLTLLRPPPYRWRWHLIRAVLLLFRAGRHGDVVSPLTRMLSTVNDPNWQRVLSQCLAAASCEQGRGDFVALYATDDDQDAAVFWRVARRSVHSRACARTRLKEDAWKYSQEAQALAATRRGVPQAMVMEDRGVLAADLGDLEQAESMQARLRGSARATRRRVVPARLTRPRFSGHQSVLQRRAQALCRVLRVRYRLLMARGSFLRASFCAKREARCALVGKETARHAACLNNAGLALIGADRVHEAAALLGSCIALRETLDDERGMVVSLNNLSVIHNGSGETSQAIAVLHRVRTIAARNGLTRHYALCLLNLAYTHAYGGHYEEARRSLRSLRQVLGEAPDTETDLKARMLTGDIAANLGHLELARRLYDSLGKMRSANHSLGYLPLLGVAEVARRTGRAADLKDALKAAQELGMPAQRAKLYESGGADRNSAVTLDGMCASDARTIEERLLLHYQRACRSIMHCSTFTIRRLMRVASKRALHRVALQYLAWHVQSERRARLWSIVEMREVLRQPQYREGHDDLHVLIVGSGMRTSIATRQLGVALAMAPMLISRSRRFARRLTRGGRHLALQSEFVASALQAIRGFSADNARPRRRLDVSALESECWSHLAHALAEYGVDGAREITEAGSNVSASLDSAADVLEALRNVLQELMTATGAKRVVLYTQADLEPMMALAAEGSGGELAGVPPSVSRTIVTQVLRTGQEHLHEDALAKEALTGYRSVAHLHLRSVLCVPAAFCGVTRGALYLDHDAVAGVFTSTRCEIARRSASLVGLLMCALESSEEARRRGEEIALAQEHLLRTQKTRVVSEITGGLAHDLKNVLAAILARTQLMARRRGSSECRAGLDSIERAAGAGVKILGRLQECFRDHMKVEREIIDVGNVLNEALDLMASRIGHMSMDGGRPIVVRREIRGHCFMRGSSGGLLEIFLNLIANACDAMPNGGELHCSATVDSDLREVVASVGDTGVGIPQTLLDRIFEPFFTTKGSSGTGLGLSVVRNAVVKMGGSVSLRSTEDVGTEFEIRFPRVTQGADVK